MNYNTIITRLYFLLIYADGNVNEKEIALANQMIKTESMQQEEFDVQMKLLKLKNKVLLFSETIAEMKKLQRVQQVRIIAWLCVVANADGFMDRTEWQLIYKIYHTELNLPLNEIFAIQKELNKAVWEKSLSIL